MPLTRWARFRQGPGARVRGLARAFPDRHGRRARALASVLDGYDDDELVLRPWEWHLPRVAVLAAARARGFEPVDGYHALVERGLWLEPIRCVRGAVR